MKRQARIGSAITLWDYELKEIQRYRIVPSCNQIRFTTMGYRTKNYAEITQVSDADGETTISDRSPLGESLIGKFMGDTVSYSIEGTRYCYKVMSVTNL